MFRANFSQQNSNIYLPNELKLLLSISPFVFEHDEDEDTEEIFPL